MARLIFRRGFSRMNADQDGETVWVARSFDRAISFFQIREIRLNPRLILRFRKRCRELLGPKLVAKLARMEAIRAEQFFTIFFDGERHMHHSPQAFCQFDCRSFKRHRPCSQDKTERLRQCRKAIHRRHA